MGNSIAPITGTSSSESITGSVEVRAGTFAVLTCTSLSGYPAGSDCSSTCGAHVHAGTACTDSSAQGIHYPDDPKDMVVLPTQPRRDPWANDIMTADNMTGTDDMGWGVSVVGSDYVDVDRKAFVVHDQANNARAACGILASGDGNGACPALEGSYEATLASLAGGNVVGKVAVHRKLDADGGKEYLAVGGYAIGLNDGADCDACTSGNCCGFHIHSGDSCADNVAQGGHLLNADGSDPWSDIKIGTS